MAVMIEFMHFTRMLKDCLVLPSCSACTALLWLAKYDLCPGVIDAQGGWWLIQETVLRQNIARCHM